MVPSVLGNLLHNGPCLHFVLQSHRGMGWASRRESREDVIVFGQRRQRVTTKCRLSLAPVQEHMRDVWVLGEQGLDDRFHESDHGTGDLLVDSSFAVR